MAWKLKPKALLLLLFVILFWGGASFYFTLYAPKYFQRALDGADWKPASGGLVPAAIRRVLRTTCVRSWTI